MMSSPFDLELLGVKMPDRETFLDDLDAHQIVQRIDSFHDRLRKELHLQVAPFAESYFLNLLALYPVSMCSKTMTSTLKLVAALFFFGSKPKGDQIKTPSDDDHAVRGLFPRIKPSPVQGGYSLEDLALIFDRNRSVIAEAIREKQEEALIELECATMRRENKKEVPAAEILTSEEKEVVIKEKAKALPASRRETRESLPC
jgi:hypothetical protein